jgi:hypothetical protein
MKTLFTAQGLQHFCFSMASAAGLLLSLMLFWQRTWGEVTPGIKPSNFGSKANALTSTPETQICLNQQKNKKNSVLKILGPQGSSPLMATDF